jgi:hypothetical protein
MRVTVGMGLARPGAPQWPVDLQVTGRTVAPKADILGMGRPPSQNWSPLAGLLTTESP